MNRNSKTLRNSMLSAAPAIGLALLGIGCSSVAQGEVDASGGDEQVGTSARPLVIAREAERSAVCWIFDRLGVAFRR